MPSDLATLLKLNSAPVESLDPGTGKAIGMKIWNQTIPLVIAASASETNTLARPTYPGQRLRLYAKTVGSSGTRTLTVTTAAGSFTVIFAAAGDYAVLESFPVGSDAYDWVVTLSKGVTGTGIPDPTFDDVTVDALTATTISQSGNHTFSSAADIVVPANTAAALEISDGTNKLLAFDSRNTIADVSNLKITAAAPTIATAVAAHKNASLEIAAKTVTYTGTATVTSSLGAQLYVNAPTFTDASAGTLSLASTVHIAAVAAAGGSLTLSAARMISTSVSDCYLTNAGVWTDTACWEYGKEAVGRAADYAYDKISEVLNKIVPATWKYRDTIETTDAATGESLTLKMDDKGRERVGIIYDDLPGELRAPGEERGVSPGILASFCLAAVKMLSERNADLEKRLAALGG